MTKRGRKPQPRAIAKIKPLDEVPDMPSFLSGEAASYWSRHAPLLVENGSLTPLLVDSFAMCCLQWGIYLYKYAKIQSGNSEDVAQDSKDAKSALASWIVLSRQFGLTTDSANKIRKASGGATAQRKLPAALEFAAKKQDFEDE